MSNDETITERDFTPLISGPQLAALPRPVGVDEYGFASMQRVRLNQRTFGMRWFKTIGPATDTQGV